MKNRPHPTLLSAFFHYAGAALAPAAALGAAGCEPVEGYDAGPVLADVVHIVILPTQADAAAKATDLDTAADALSQAPTADSLAAAQAAWRTARAPWRSCDAFAFGPVESEGLGAAIDWWPAKPDTIEEKIAAGVPIDAAYIESLGTSAKGFMALEYLLFDPAGGEAAVLASLEGDPAAARRAYVAAVAADLAAKSDALRAAWAEDQGNYAKEILLAGDGSQVFGSQKAAVDELVNQLVFRADVLLNAKIGKPAGNANGGVPLPDTEESPRSDNSLADMLATLAGLRAVYEGEYGGKDGMGIADLVRARNAGVDDRVRAAFADAKGKIEAIPAPFRTAVTEHPAEVTAAYESVRVLKRTLATEVVSVLGSTLRFNDADGD
jgi:predicted lipoprotein